MICSRADVDDFRPIPSSASMHTSKGMQLIVSEIVAGIMDNFFIAFLCYRVPVVKRERFLRILNDDDITDMFVVP